jgi:hypothetical protein
VTMPRDRIGRSPWQNAKGDVIAKDVAELHGSNNLTKQTALTEKGEVVNGRGDTPNTHDALTGSQPDGTAFTGNQDMDLRQLDEERHRGRSNAGPPRPDGLGRVSSGEVLECIACLTGRMQPGRAQEHRRCRSVLLLRRQLADVGNHDTGKRPGSSPAQRNCAPVALQQLGVPVRRHRGLHVRSS